MNLTQIKEKFPILIVPIGLIVLILTLAIIISLLTFKKPPQQPQIPPTPTPQLTPTPIYRIIPPRIDPDTLPSDIKQIRQQIIDSRISEKGGVFLLFQSDTYVINYISSPDFFKVSIFKEPIDVYKKQAQNWFLQFGLKQSELCDLPVRFHLATRELRQANPNFTSLPDGC